MSTKRYQEPIDPISGGHLHYVQCTYTRTIQQVSEMVAFGDLKVAGGELVEGAGIYHMYNYIYTYSISLLWFYHVFWSARNGTVYVSNTTHTTQWPDVSSEEVPKEPSQEVQRLRRGALKLTHKLQTCLLNILNQQSLINMC